MIFSSSVVYGQESMQKTIHIQQVIRQLRMLGGLQYFLTSNWVCANVCSGTFLTTFLRTGRASAPICRPLVVTTVTRCQKLALLVGLHPVAIVCLRLMHCGWTCMAVWVISVLTRDQQSARVPVRHCSPWLRHTEPCWRSPRGRRCSGRYSSNQLWTDVSVDRSPFKWHFVT